MVLRSNTSSGSSSSFSTPSAPSACMAFPNQVLEMSSSSSTGPAVVGGMVWCLLDCLWACLDHGMDGWWVGGLVGWWTLWPRSMLPHQGLKNSLGQEDIVFWALEHVVLLLQWLVGGVVGWVVGCMPDWL
eukprot:5356682-Prorocentrum_lima.AAC.1